MARALRKSPTSKPLRTGNPWALIASQPERTRDWAVTQILLLQTMHGNMSQAWFCHESFMLMSWVVV
eukprot:1368473-Alexandrium_andersonii.AAC.1